MNDSKTRADLFVALHALAELVPQMRVGQLMAAVGEKCSDLHERGLWDAEDDELLEAIWQFRRGIEQAAVGCDPSNAKPVAAGDPGRV
jgi:hypothetical protein